MNNTTMDKMKTPGWFSEPKNIATTIIALSLAAGLTYGFLTFVLPWLVTVTWNLVNLVIGGVVLGFLLMIVSSKKFWRTLKYFSEFIANYTIGLAIELNPFAILESKIDQLVSLPAPVAAEKPSRARQSPKTGEKAPASRAKASAEDKK